MDAKTRKNIAMASAGLGGFQLLVSPFVNWSLASLPSIGGFVLPAVGIGLFAVAYWINKGEV